MKTLLLIFIISLLYSTAILSQECNWCKRRAILSECNNDIVEGSDKIHSLTVRNLTFPAIGSHCFSWLATPADLEQFEGMPEKETMEFNLKHDRSPEYLFKAFFETGLTGITKPKELILTSDTTDYWDVTSRFTMELYYNGDTEEFVDKWVTLGTNNQTVYHYQNMFKNSDAEMKKKNPLDIMYEFEQTPTGCTVNPQSETIHTNNSMEIEITDFEGYYGGKPKPFNRIIVHALHGKITNGNESAIGPDYKVFTIDDGLVTVNYQAPGNCESRNDRITVFNSCDILPSSKWPMEKTTIKDCINEKNIDVVCDYEWSGTMTIEKIERFDCELDKSTDDSWGHTKLHELSTTRATVSIRAENIDDSPPGFNINMGENLMVSGFMKCEYNNTEIIDGRKSGMNPSTSHHKETLVGEDLFNLSHKNLNLMFTSNMEDFQQDGSLEEMTKMLETGNIDQAELAAFGKKFEESMGSGEAGKSKITVFLTIFGDCMCKATLSQNGWTVKNGERTTTNESVNMDLTIGGAVALDFTADYIRNKNGSATIIGNYSKITPITGGLRKGCPPKEETITCSLNLSKRPKK